LTMACLGMASILVVSFLMDSSLMVSSVMDAPSMPLRSRGSHCPRCPKSVSPFMASASGPWANNNLQGIGLSVGLRDADLGSQDGRQVLAVMLMTCLGPLESVTPSWGDVPPGGWPPSWATPFADVDDGDGRVDALGQDDDLICVLRSTGTQCTLSGTTLNAPGPPYRLRH
jgi:hypothetical protein